MVHTTPAQVFTTLQPLKVLRCEISAYNPGGYRAERAALNLSRAFLISVFMQVP